MKKVAAPVVEPRLLGIKGASTYLGCTIWAMRAMVWAKKLPHIRIGQRILFDRVDLDRFVESQKAA